MYTYCIYSIAYIIFNICYVAYMHTYVARVQKGDYLDREKRQTEGGGWKKAAGLGNKSKIQDTRV